MQSGFQYSSITVAAAMFLTSATAVPGNTLNNATLSGDVSYADGNTTTITNNLTLNSADVELRGLWEFLGTNTIGGSGRIHLVNTGDINLVRSSHSGIAPGHQLTIGSGVEVVGSRENDTGSPRITYHPTSFIYDPDRLINYGVLAAEGDPDDTGSDLWIYTLAMENYGLVTARSGGHMFLWMRDAWQNDGVYRVEDGGTFTLAGTIDTTTLGTLESQGTGQFLLQATLENAGNTLTLDASTGSLQLWYINTINGGRVEGLDGAKLFSHAFDNRLLRLELNQGVVLDTDVDIFGSSADVEVRGGLTINKHFFFNGDLMSVIGDDPAVGSTLDGMGLLELNDGLNFSEPLTIGADLTVRGGSYAAEIESSSASTLTNLGTIEALAHDRLDIESDLSQQGMILADDGDIQLEGNTHNTGSIVVTNNGSVRFDAGTQSGQVSATNGGKFRFFGGANTAAGTVSATNGGVVQVSFDVQNDGSISVDDGFLWLENGQVLGNAAVVTDSTVVLSNNVSSAALPSVPRTNSGWGLYSGTLDNTGNTITLNADGNTQWTLYGISFVVGGTIDSTDGTPLRMGHFLEARNSNATLDAVALQTQILLGQGHTLTAINGTTLSGGVMFDGGGLLVLDQPTTFADLPTMTGTGGAMRLLSDLDLGGATWTLPAAVNTVELSQYSQGGELPLSVSLVNGEVVGSATQRLMVPGRAGGDPVVFNNLTLAVDVDLLNTYSLAVIQDDVTLDGATLRMWTGPLSGPIEADSLIRHGELQLAVGGQLLGQGELRFVQGYPGGFGGFTTIDDELIISQDITVIGGDGRGLIGTDTGPTRNQGTLRAETRPDGRSSLLIVGTGLENTGTLEVEPGGWIDVVGDATLGGELLLDYAGATGLNEGDVFDVLTASSLLGGFDLLTVQLPPELDGLGLGAALIYGPDSVSARISLIGDLNGDGFVGLEDLDLLINAWNQPVSVGDWSAGDASGDGFVGLDDLDALLNSWNTGTPPGAVTSVPEPALIAWLMMGGLMLTGNRRRH